MISIDERQAMEAEVQQARATAQRDMCRLCLVAAEQNDLGGAAASFRIRAREAETWAEVAATFCDEGELEQVMNGAFPLDHKRWRAIVDCPDPRAAYEAAAEGEWSSGRIRREFCGPKAATKPRRLRGRLRSWVRGILQIEMPLNESPPTPLPSEAIIIIEEEPHAQ